MRFLLAFVFLFSCESIAGLPPTTAKGQAEANNTTTFNFQAPNNTFTTVGAGTRLVETGNFNALANPGFEHTTATTSWTGANVSAASETTNKHSGAKSVALTYTAATPTWTQSVTTNVSQLTGTQGVSVIWLKTSDTLAQACSYVDGAAVDCVNAIADSAWREYVIPFVFGATNYGIQIRTSASSTGTIYADDAYSGIMPATMMPDVAQSVIAAEMYIAGTTNCAGWTRASTTMGAVATDADCPGPTVVVNNVGEAQTTDANLPRFTINNLPPGQYKARMDFGQVTTAGSISLAINDGTTTCEPVWGNQDTGSALGQSVECSFTYTSTGNRSFELYVGSTTGTVTIPNAQTSPRASIKFILEYFPPPSKIYSQASSNTDWVDCGLGTGDFTGFGTVSSIEDLCKREGSDLLMSVKFTSGTSTATEARVALKLLSGALTAASSSVIPSISAAGIVTRAQVGAAAYYALKEPAVGYITFGAQSSGGGALTKLDGSTLASSGNAVSFMARVPISGWVGNVITGTFAGVVVRPGTSKPVSCAALCAAGSETTDCTVTGACTLYRKQGECGLTCTKNATTGTYDWDFDTAIMTGTTALCTAQNAATSSSNLDCTSGQPNSSGSFSAFCRNQNTSAAANNLHIVRCDGFAP